MILQENGRLAAEGDPSTLPAARRLVEEARKAGAEPLFYMTWAYRDRPQTLGQVHPTYYLLGSRLDVPVAPVGEAFRLARETHPEIELFNEDGVHPSPEGSYLAACLIFAMVYDRIPEGLPASTPAGEAVAPIGAAAARALQRIAALALTAYPQPNHP